LLIQGYFIINCLEAQKFMKPCSKIILPSSPWQVRSYPKHVPKTSEPPSRHVVSMS
jgi:hypothetical protein